MNELQMIERRHKARMNQGLYSSEEKEPQNLLSKTFSKILISIIFILLSCIYIHWDSKNLETYKTTVFESNLTFAKMNQWYHEMFGEILPTVASPTETLASNTPSSLIQEEYLDGYKVKTTAGSPIQAQASGILVYLAEKDGYGNTAIIQGIDGVDIWYGNLVDTNVKLYDYIEAGTILGNAKEEYYYTVFYKDGKKVTYEDYQGQVQS